MRLPGAMLPSIFRYIFRKPATVLYPFERLTPPLGLRGKMRFHPDRCISCGQCEKVCPSGACKIHELDGKKRPVFDLDRCTFCAQCAETCPKEAIEMTAEFELAHYKRGEALVK